MMDIIETPEQEAVSLWNILVDDLKGYGFDIYYDSGLFKVCRMESEAEYFTTLKEVEAFFKGYEARECEGQAKT